MSLTTSAGLVQRVDQSPKITFHVFSEITRLDGDRYLREVAGANRATGQTQSRSIGNVFVMIGAEPDMNWLNDCLDLNDKGFVITGRDGEGKALASHFATTRPGVFAICDVRPGSFKRVASGVGEG
ncbi:NAD(P)/FAD-dependent oxidoreductase [Bosea thiooxidans]